MPNSTTPSTAIDGLNRWSRCVLLATSRLPGYRPRRGHSPENGLTACDDLIDPSPNFSYQ